MADKVLSVSVGGNVFVLTQVAKSKGPKIDPRGIPIEVAPQLDKSS